MRKLKTDPRFVFDRVNVKDLEALAELYARYARGFRMAPQLTIEKLRHYLQDQQLFSYDQYYVARDQQGTIQAVTALWDEHRYKQYALQALSPPLHLLNGLLRVGRIFFPLPQPLRAHQAIRHASFILYAHNNCPEALEALFCYVNNQQLGKDYQILTLYAQQRDPIFSLLKAHRGISVFSEMYVFAKDPEKLEAFKNADQMDGLDVVLTV
jgi:hypothetical protein